MTKVFENVVVSSRVRLARNFKGIPFPQKLKDTNAVNLIVNSAVKASNFENKLLFMKNLSPLDRLTYVERHLISVDLINHSDISAFILSEDESIAVMVNEEDHIRAQCIKKGMNLNECYNIINQYDNKLAQEMPIAYDSEFGYLTACLTNVGTGMRASVMLFLPAMTYSKTIDKYIKIAQKKGITVRGVYGERSSPEGCMYQLSNTKSLGISEQNLLERVETIVDEFCAIEQGLRQTLYNKNKIYFEDKVYRAYGILTNARSLPSSEFMEIMSLLKFGIAMKIIGFKDIELLDKMVVLAQPANLCKFSNNQKLTPEMRDIVRAKYVRDTLISLK